MGVIKIKDGGVWKSSTNTFIKIAGAWKEAKSTFMKVGGHWLNINHLATNTFTYDGTILRDKNKQAYLVNKDDPTKFKAIVYSGVYSQFKGSTTASVPVNVTLGKELVSLNDLALNDPTKDPTPNHRFRASPGTTLTYDKSSATLRVTGDGSHDIGFMFNEDLPADLIGYRKIVLNFSKIPSKHLICNTVRFTPKLGLNVLSFHNTLGHKGISLRSERKDIVDFTLQGVGFSIKNVESVEGSITYFDTGKRAFVSPHLHTFEYILKDVKCGVLISLHNTKFTQEDMHKIKITPELLIDWNNGNQSGLSIAKSVDDKVYYDVSVLPHKGTLAVGASQFGLQSIKLDASVNIKGEIDRRFVMLPMVDPKKARLYLVRDIKEIRGDVTQFSVTYYPEDPANSFKFKIRIANAGDTFKLPVRKTGYYDYTVDWGDSKSDSIVGFDSPKNTHTYATAGDYDIAISGVFSNILFQGSLTASSVIEVNNLGKTKVAFINFRGTKITKFHSGVCDTSRVKSIQYTWYNVKTLVDMDITTMDTHNITNMYNPFPGVPATNINLNNFDVSKVTKFIALFSGLKIASVDLSSWDTSSAERMSDMFSYTVMDRIDLSMFDTSNVTKMLSMFIGSKATVINLSGFNTSKVKNMSRMFERTNFISIDLSSFDTAKVEDMDRMFSGAIIVDPPIDKFNIASLTKAPNIIKTTQSFTTAHYDKVLIAWANQPHQKGVSVGFGKSKYTAGGAAEAARNKLVADGWVIVDGGTA